MLEPLTPNTLPISSHFDGNLTAGRPATCPPPHCCPAAIRVGLIGKHTATMSVSALDADLGLEGSEAKARLPAHPPSKDLDCSLGLPLDIDHQPPTRRLGTISP